MATLYDDISLGYHACGGSKVGKLYSFKPTDGSGDFTCVRATTPNRINENGDTEVVPVNTPVIDWSTGSPLLIVTVEGELTLTTPASATKIVITIDGEDVEYNNVFPTLSLPVGSITKVIATVGGTEYDLLKAYLLRVDTASGTINEQGARDLKSMYEFLDDEGLLSGLELLYLSNAGIVQRTDGVLKYVRTAFDASDNDNDLDGSATASQQPRLVGGIAPNSKPAASNQTGEVRYFTHPEISFVATDAWSVTTVLNLDGNLIPESTWYCGYKIGTTNLIGIHSNNVFSINKAVGYNFNSSSVKFGKNIYVTWVANGLGILYLYINGLFVEQKSLTTDFKFNSLINSFTAVRGKVLAHHIQSGALTATQVTSLYNTLRGMYPEIESTTIGTQTWASRNFEAVATPLGNVIANVTENGAVEKISSINLTTIWVLIGNVVGAETTANYFRTTSAGGYRLAPLTVGKYYKPTYNLTSSGGAGVYNSNGTPENGIISGNIFKAVHTYVYIRNSGAGETTINSFTLEELNWSNATEIYDAVYAATAGTTAQKEYAALKEAADWAYHSNSVNYGASFGKIYNGYGKLLLVKDIASSTGWGYHVTTKAELTALALQTGFKLKYGGTDHWLTANGTNETGFTALGGASRATDGTFNTIKATASFWCADTDEVLTIYDDGTAVIEAKDKTFGAYIRLVKD